MSADFHFERITPFSLEHGAVRGRLVRLDNSLDTILQKHNYPLSVAKILAETISVVTALSSNLKFEGVFSVSIHSNGPISLLVADVTSEGGIRGYAQYAEEKTEALDINHTDLLFKTLLTDGQLIFTLDQGPNKDRYQGIVDLIGRSITNVFQHYFSQSEQLDTFLKTALQYENHHWTASTLLLQKIPSSEIEEEIDPVWPKTVLFAETLQNSELLNFSCTSSQLIDRLFHELSPLIYDEKPVKAKCRCSRGRIISLLRSFPKEEIANMKENDKIVVTCQFCSEVYFLSEEDFQLRIVR